MAESVRLCLALQDEFAPDKLNTAALGNIVPQLHIHHIVRYVNDPAWPAPVWGRVPAKAYTSEKLHSVLGAVRQALGDDVEWLQALA
jgi:diadenosine tetraphosphate (Ap4A) HIT family hydrolase